MIKGIEMDIHSVAPETVMAYTDGQLPSDEAAGVRAHLEECAECRALAAAFEQVSQQMREWTVEPPSPQLTWRVAASARPVRPWLKRWQWPVVAFASVVAIFLVLPVEKGLGTLSDGIVHLGGPIGISKELSTRDRQMAAMTPQPKTARQYEGGGSMAMARPAPREPRKELGRRAVDGKTTPPGNGVTNSVTIGAPSNALPSTLGGVIGDIVERRTSAVYSAAPATRDSQGPAGVVSETVRLRSDGLSKSLAPIGPMVARDATLTLSTKEFAAAREAVGRTVVAHRGYVQNLATSGQPAAGRTLVATLRFPSEQLEGALAELRALGVVEQESQNGEDLLQPHVDLSARLINARTAEKRLNELLAQRTAKVDDVLNIEYEMARVREEIEGLEAELRSMDKRVELAKVNLHINETTPKPPAPPAASSWTRLWSALGEGFAALRDDLVFLVEFLLRYLPYLLVWAALLFFPIRWGWRKYQERIKPGE
jgi:hypothetical protein